MDCRNRENILCVCSHFKLVFAKLWGYVCKNNAFRPRMERKLCARSTSQNFLFCRFNLHQACLQIQTSSNEWNAHSIVKRTFSMLILRRYSSETPWDRRQAMSDQLPLQNSLNCFRNKCICATRTAQRDSGASRGLSEGMSGYISILRIARGDET